MGRMEQKVCRAMCSNLCIVVFAVKENGEKRWMTEKRGETSIQGTLRHLSDSVCLADCLF